MKKSTLKQIIQPGEDSSYQFKADIHNIDSLAVKLTAFANSSGGTIYIGVCDDGSISGLSTEDVTRINQLISNCTSQHVRSPRTVTTENIANDEGGIVIVLTVP